MKRLLSIALLLFLIPKITFAEDYYGAIAHSYKRSIFGYSWDYESQKQADRRALRNCGRGCEVIARFRNACAAIARGIGAYGYAIGTRRRLTRKTALRQCRKHRGRSCRVVRTICTQRIDASDRYNYR